MLYTLEGKIAKAHPYQLDKTLTVEGAGAEAEATGKAIAAIKTTAEGFVKEHGNNKDNPHNVTAAQLGLGEVDNTSDMDKPVSTAQARAIAEAKETGLSAQAAAEHAQTIADNAAADSLPLAGGQMLGDIDMGGKHIVGLPEPTLDDDIITKAYMETYIETNLLGGVW